MVAATFRLPSPFTRGMTAEKTKGDTNTHSFGAQRAPHKCHQHCTGPWPQMQHWAPRSAPATDGIPVCLRDRERVTQQTWGQKDKRVELRK
mmetsp:Transcript_16531/g.28951  ORF Transcript_16531/g.28951 Transcript_16531/m.28951 type:complete len:91 (-) Transcript_16531:1032-1304(-)